MKDTRWDMESGMEHEGPPVQVRSHQTHGPRLTAFEVTRALNNAVWEKAKIENDRTRKETD